MQTVHTEQWSVKFLKDHQPMGGSITSALAMTSSLYSQKGSNEHLLGSTAWRHYSVL